MFEWLMTLDAIPRFLMFIWIVGAIVIFIMMALRLGEIRSDHGLSKTGAIIIFCILYPIFWPIVIAGHLIQKT